MTVPAVRRSGTGPKVRHAVDFKFEVDWVNEKTQWASPDLQSLVDLFYEDSAELGHFDEVACAELPAPFGELLDHNRHMTVTVEAFHHSPVDVEVLQSQSTENHYSRKILLRRQSDHAVVQFGIVRINRTSLPGQIMDRIQRQDTPLGRILIENQMMRNVKRLSLWRITPGPALLQAFEAGPFEICFGRTAFLYLDALPVVELLEIVKV